jgi:hypothetical protein
VSLFVIDTDTLSLYERDHERVKARIDAKPAPKVAIAVITVEEQLSGCVFVASAIKAQSGGRERLPAPW